MGIEQIFENTNGAYLHLVQPNLKGDVYRKEIAPIINLAHSVLDDQISELIVGSSWRERLMGLCFAISNKPASFVDAVRESLHNPRGIVIVPSCAMLLVLAKRQIFQIPKNFGKDLNRDAIDGEVGWAVDKMLFSVELAPRIIPDRGPNYGQNFEDHFMVYDWIYSSTH